MEKQVADVLPRRLTGSGRTELRASQRGRLICAVADVAAEKGYSRASVADVCSKAGVSRRAFYEHFEDKDDCFAAAYEFGAQRIYEAMLAEIDATQPWPVVLDRVLTVWLAVLESDRAFARAFLIEFWAAGEQVRERWTGRRDRTVGLVAALHERVLAEDPEVTRISPTMIGAVVGGINRAVVDHLVGEERAPLGELRPEIARFITAVVAAPTTPVTPLAAGCHSEGVDRARGRSRRE